MSLPRCLLCNSASHTHMACNSNMKGRRDMLVALGKSMMMDNIMPDFKSFPIDELKYIAHTYTTEILGFNRYKPLVAVKSSVHVDSSFVYANYTDTHKNPSSERANASLELPQIGSREKTHNARIRRLPNVYGVYGNTRMERTYVEMGPSRQPVNKRSKVL